jgi:hypothetical protein
LHTAADNRHRYLNIGHNSPENQSQAPRNPYALQALLSGFLQPVNADLPEDMFGVDHPVSAGAQPSRGIPGWSAPEPGESAD